MSGRVIGVPGSVIASAGGGDACLRQRGASAERDTARVLDRLAEEGMVVIHSLGVPGADADVDHVLVGSRGAVLIDSKLWRPGWYVGRSRHWRWCSGDSLPQPFPYADSPSLALSAASMAGSGVRVRGAVVAAWPSRPGRVLRTRLMRYHGGYRVMDPVRAVDWAARRAGRGPADEAVVAAVVSWAR